MTVSGGADRWRRCSTWQRREAALSSAKVGSFEQGYEFDAVVLDDTRLKHPQPLDVRSRLERMIYLADEREIRAKYVKGKEIDLT